MNIAQRCSLHSLVAALRDVLVEMRPGLSTGSVSDEEFSLFLHYQDRNVNRAAKTYLNFVTFVEKHNLDLRTGSTLVPFQQTLRAGVFQLVNGPDMLGRPVLFVFPERITFFQDALQILKNSFLLLVYDILLNERNALDIGIVIVLKMEGLSSTQLCWEFISFLSQALNESVPIVLSALYLVDPPNVLPYFLHPFLKMSLSRKLMDRVVYCDIHNHGFHDFLAISNIPREYGGTFQFDAEAFLNNFYSARSGVLKSWMPKHLSSPNTNKTSDQSNKMT